MTKHSFCAPFTASFALSLDYVEFEISKPPATRSARMHIAYRCLSLQRGALDS